MGNRESGNSVKRIEPAPKKCKIFRRNPYHKGRSLCSSYTGAFYSIEVEREQQENNHDEFHCTIYAVDALMWCHKKAWNGVMCQYHLVREIASYCCDPFLNVPNHIEQPILWVYENRGFDEFKLLLDICEVSKGNGILLLNNMIRAGDVRGCQLVLRQKNVSVNRKIKKGCFPIDKAVIYDQPEIMDLLLGFDNLQHNLTSMLVRAIVSDSQRVFERLLGMGGIQYDRIVKKKTPLMWAIDENRVNMARELMEKSDLSVVDHDGRTVLMLAVIGGKIDLVQLLLNCSLEVFQVRDKAGRNVLRYAHDGSDSQIKRVIFSHPSVSKEGLIRLLI